VRRRDFLRSAAAAAALAGCAAPPRRTPPPYEPAEFAGKVGLAREDITPPVGIYARNWGAAAHERAEGIHRPLTATALALSDGGAPLVLIALDLGWWRRREDEGHVRGAVLRALSLDPARLMVNMSHTHAGPATCREDVDKPGGELIAPYLDQVRDAAVRAARRAVDGLAPGTLSWGLGRCDLAVNRDLEDPAKERRVTGYNPFATADDAVLVGRVCDLSGKILGVLVNYACHPTTLAWENKLISPDYPGAMRELIEERNPGALALYLHGPSGDVAPRRQYTGELEVADRNGRQLGYAVLSALEGMLAPRTRLEYAGVVESGAPCAVWTSSPRTPSGVRGARKVDVELPLKPAPSAAELEVALKACEDRVQAERLRRKLRVRRTVGEGATARMPLWVWRIGEGFLVGQPNEAYTRLQAELRAAFPGRAVSALNLVNGSVGYLPPAELYDLDLYQVWQTPFGRGSLERVIAAADEALRSLLT
jgi:hypothetical protein